MNKKSLQIMFVLMCLLVLSGSAFAARGRPHVDSSLGFKTLLSDDNTLLRGVSLSWDGGDPYGSKPKVMPSLDSLIALREVYGLNTVHLFLEGDSSENPNPVGYNAADCDTLVQRCAQAGLYLIITIGCNGENGQIYDLQFCVDFWNFYAPRYKNDTHVIYEAKNEPVAYTCGHWTVEDWDKQVVLYDAMRPNAPDTLLLMFTFQGFNNPGQCVAGVDYLEANGVDWSNAGVAWHGYTALGAIEDVLDLFSSSADYPPTLCTEFYPGDTEGQLYNASFESYFTGWMQFQWLTANDADLTGFVWKIETAGTVWTPELGDWPTKSSPAIPSNGSSVGIFDRGQEKFVGINATGDLRADLATYTGSQDDEFILEQVSSSIESGFVALKASNGLYVSTTGEADSLTPDSSSVGNTEKFQWYELPNAEVVLRSIGSGHLINSKDYRGKLVILPDADNAGDVVTNYAFVDGTSPSDPPPAPEPDPEPDPGPYYGTPLDIPGVIEAEDFDYGGEGVAYHDSEPENLGGAYRPEEGVDIEACSEGGADVGWIDNGEWMEYTVDVATADTYTVDVRVAGGPGTFHIEFDGVDKTGTMTNTETGGWQVWVDRTATVSLSAGVQIMRFVADSGGYNLNNFTFTSGGSGEVCGDDTCDAGEDQCNCPEDCGTPPSTETSCTDGDDNDCDNDVDCDDSDCLGDPACPSCGDETCDPGEDQCNCPDDCGTPPSTETSCTDEVDNDCDTYTDCDDSDCDGDPACPDCLPKGAACTDNAECCSGNCLPAGKCAK